MNSTRHLKVVLGDHEPIDPRRGLRIAAETNRVQAAIRGRKPTAFLIERERQLDDETDKPKSLEAGEP